MQCFACAAAIEVAASERVGFRDSCEACGVDLHVCRNCAHHDPSAYNECRESSAERVADRDRANRCDYFRPAPGATAVDTTTQALSELDTLFKK
ncbi:MAG: hypothetical protein IH884_13230 [Myxococcales bacterium]|nr:hypothetical protein [Myxococcales bacterium]